MNIINDIATIEGQEHIQLDVLIQPVMSPRDEGLPVLETTLSLPATEQVAAFCEALSLGTVITFRLMKSGQMDLYYIGKNGNYYQFFSHPNLAE